MTKKRKLYCYVDEIGQDTRGQLFVVVALLTGGDQRDSFVRQLKTAEMASGSVLGFRSFSSRCSIKKTTVPFRIAAMGRGWKA